MELDGDFDALIWNAWHIQVGRIPHKRLDSKVVSSYQSPPEGLRSWGVVMFQRDLWANMKDSQGETREDILGYLNCCHWKQVGRGVLASVRLWMQL